MSDNTKSLQKFDADLNIIQKLGDEPNTDNNLNAAELKEKFDEAANIIQQYINEVLIPYAEGKANGTHAEQHAKDGTDPVTPLSIGALPLSGNSAEAPMTGDIYRKASEGTSGGRIHQRDGQAVLYSYTDLETDDNYRALEVNAPDGAYSGLSKAISFVERKNGVETRYNLLHDGVIGGLGLPQFAYGSYVGTGKSGSSNKNKLTFDFVPRIVFIVAKTASMFHSSQYTLQEWVMLVNGMTKTLTRQASDNVGTGTMTISWSGQTVSWYASWAGGQINTSGVSYLYVAFG